MPAPPVNPENFDKVNYVIDSWTTGCDAPWYIYISTLKPALLTAFITLITFGWDDVLRGMFRPRGLYKRRSGKRKGKWVRRIPRFPEIGNTLGKQMPIGEEVRGKKWGWGVNTLWRIDGGMEAIRFFWLVAAITEDLAFDWTSLLYETYWCRDTARGRFSWRVDNYFFIASGRWYPPGYGILDYQTPPPSYNLISGLSGAKGCTVAATISFKPHPSYPGAFDSELRIRNNTSGAIISTTGQNESPPDGVHSLALSGNVAPGVRFVVEARVWVTLALYGDGIVTATANEDA